MLALFLQIAFVVGNRYVLRFGCIGQHVQTDSGKYLFLGISIFITRLHGDNVLHKGLVEFFNFFHDQLSI